MRKVQVIQATKGPLAERIPVAAYCRVSSNSEDQRHSFAAQVREYTAEIESNPKWALAGIYADEGISGTSARKRPEFQRLLEDCRQGKVKRILTKSISRFARNTQECLECVRELKLLGVSIYFEKEGLDTGDLAGELLVSVFGSLAQEESASISSNVRISNQRRMARGEFLSTPVPYGYRLVDKQYVIYEPEAQKVRDVFNSYLDGISISHIAQKLQSLEPDGSPKMWRAETIRIMLINEKYMGDALHQKRYTSSDCKKTEHRNRGEYPQYYVTNSHPAIVSREVFLKAQELRSKRYHREGSAKQHKEAIYYRHLLQCDACGHSLRMKRHHNGTLGWVCNYHDKHRDLCPAQPILDVMVQSAVNDFVKNLHMHISDMLLPLCSQLRLLRDRTVTGDADLNTLNQQIVSLNDQLHAVHKLYSMNLLDVAAFKERTNALDAQLQEVQTKRKQLIADTSQDNALEQTERILEALEAVDVEYTESIEDVFREIVEKVLVDKDKRITFRLINGLELVGREGVTDGTE